MEAMLRSLLLDIINIMTRQSTMMTTFHLTNCSLHHYLLYVDILIVPENQQISSLTLSVVFQRVGNLPGATIITVDVPYIFNFAVTYPVSRIYTAFVSNNSHQLLH